MKGKHRTFFLILLVFLLPLSFLMGQAVTAPPKKSIEEILTIFDEKAKSVEQLSQKDVLAKPGAARVKTNASMEFYQVPAGVEGYYLYTFMFDHESDGKPYLQSISLFKKPGDVTRSMYFKEGKMLGYSDNNVYMNWHPNTFKPWHYYEIIPGNSSAYRKVVLDANGKAMSDQYSATGGLSWDLDEALYLSEEEREIARKRIEEKQAKARAEAEARFHEPRDVAIARLRKEMAENPNDPDNFFKEFDIACRYLAKFDRKKGELPDFVKGKEIIFHCFEAYPQHANNVEMLRLKEYLGDIYRTNDETDKAIETYYSVINTDPKSIVMYYPNTGVQTGARAQKEIDVVRWAATQGLVSVTKWDKGGIPAVKKLLEQRPDDKVFQSTVREVLDAEIKNAERTAKQDKENEESMRRIMDATTNTLTTTASQTTKAVKP
jgi:hypothetical protein